MTYMKLSLDRHCFCCFLFITGIMLFSCVSDVDIGISKSDPLITLNCILHPEQDTVTAWVSHTRPVLSAEPFQPVKDAIVVLYENGRPIGQFLQSDSTAWVLPFSVKPGAGYKLEVISGNSQVWAETTVPQLIAAEIDSVQKYTFRLEYVVSFFDNPDEKNYYWVTATGYTHYYGLPWHDLTCCVDTDYSLADDFNRYIDNFGDYRYSYDTYIRIPDSSIPSGSVQFQFQPGCIDHSLGPQTVHLLSVDYNLDKYMKSGMQNHEIEILAEDSPIVFAPFPIYSNIYGGTGIFGSYSSISKEFSLKGK